MQREGPPPTHSAFLPLAAQLPHSFSLVWAPNGNQLQAQLPCPSFLSFRSLHPAHPASERELPAPHPWAPRTGGPRDKAELPTSCLTPARQVACPDFGFPTCTMGKVPPQGHPGAHSQGEEVAKRAGQARAWRAWKARLCSVDWTLQTRPWQALALMTPKPEPSPSGSQGPSSWQPQLYLGSPQKLGWSFNLRNHSVQLHSAEEGRYFYFTRFTTSPSIARGPVPELPGPLSVGSVLQQVLCEMGFPEALPSAEPGREQAPFRPFRNRSHHFGAA